jgi:hypothetical protein
MTYDKALEIIGACLGGSTNRKNFKEALRIAHKAIRAELGRMRRFDTDLESAESDYVRDFAYEQGLDGENADEFFGKVKADGFDMMEAYHDGAEWYRENKKCGIKLDDYRHIKEILSNVLGSRMSSGEIEKVLDALDEQVKEVGMLKD